jgi:hypothetical protein
MKNKSQLVIGLCIACLCLSSVPNVSARAKKAPDASSSPATSAAASPAGKTTTKERGYPFHGMISAVDTKAKTFTIAGKQKSRVFKITDRSVLTKAGSAATMKDVAEKEEVRGSYWKNADGTLEARNVKLGPLTDQEKAAEEARKAKRAERKKAKEAAASTSPASSPAASPKP